MEFIDLGYIILVNFYVVTKSETHVFRHKYRHFFLKINGFVTNTAV